LLGLSAAYSDAITLLIEIASQAQFDSTRAIRGGKRHRAFKDMPSAKYLRNYFPDECGDANDWVSTQGGVEV